MVTHHCPKCLYTTNRKYNLDRHIEMVHKTSKNLVHERTPQLHERTPQLHERAPQLHERTPPMDFCSKENSEKLELAENTCKDCLKQFSSARKLRLHKDHCKKEKLDHICDVCSKRYASMSSLSNHKHRCKGSVLATNASPAENAVNTCSTQNIETQNIVTNNTNCNNNITNNNNNTVNVMLFPKDGDQNFDFAIEHIQDAIMKKFITQSKPEVGFEMFMDMLMEHPANKIVHKTNPNTKYSKIHVGDGKYEFATDTKVMPIVTHHMTTAALAKVNEMKPKPIFAGIRQKAKEFVKYIDEVTLCQMNNGTL